MKNHFLYNTRMPWLNAVKKDDACVSFDNTLSSITNPLYWCSLMGATIFCMDGIMPINCSCSFLSYQQNNRLAFYYKMEGIDREWSIKPTNDTMQRVVARMREGWI